MRTVLIALMLITLSAPCYGYGVVAEQTEDGVWVHHGKLDKAPDNPYIVVDHASLPSREYRNCWKIVNGTVVIDQTMADELDLERDVSGKIKDKIRKMAIDELKKEGELPQDYKESKGV